jgi:hypothetical protein
VTSAKIIAHLLAEHAITKEIIDTLDYVELLDLYRHEHAKPRANYAGSEK